MLSGNLAGNRRGISPGVLGFLQQFCFSEFQRAFFNIPIKNPSRTSIGFSQTLCWVTSKIDFTFLQDLLLCFLEDFRSPGDPSKNLSQDSSENPAEVHLGGLFVFLLEIFHLHYTHRICTRHIRPTSEFLISHVIFFIVHQHSLDFQ